MSEHRFHIDIKNLLNLPASVYWKNDEGYYLGCNDVQLESVGYASNKDFIGTTLYDHCKILDADIFTATDNNILKTQTSRFLIEKGRDVKKHLYLTIKQPLYNADNKIAGLYGISFNLRDEKFQNNLNVLLNTPTLNSIGFINGVKETFIQTLDHSEIHLTSREKECLRYIRQGRTTKEIAAFLKISPRTVETHIEHIKIKFKCNTKSQLLDRLITYDFI